jgi:NADH:ubiquinone oxidoreductase subunit 2 (subunit N)
MTYVPSRFLSRTALVASGTLAALALPLVSFAAVSNLSDFGTLIINTINNILVPVLFAIAFIVFLWGAFQAFIVGSQNDTAKEKGKSLMLWGLIGFFVMVSIWGLVNILVGTISFSDKTGPTGGTPKADFKVGT